ncbi:MAG TPA: helix-turn-helix transcriptional regulator [Candidatus Binatia bacterium]
MARIAALIGDPSRAAILLALLDGRALPAGELAQHASISPQTASAHLDKLFRAHLLSVEIQGRHHYYRLRNPQVARLLESLSIVVPPGPAPAHRDSTNGLRFARICYDHLAGRLGVAVTRALCDQCYIDDGEVGYTVTDTGRAWFGSLGLDVEELRASRRPLTRRCLDWSERRFHLAGGLGAALTNRLVKLNWITRARSGRLVRLTEKGERALRAQLQLDF